MTANIPLVFLLIQILLGVEFDVGIFFDLYLKLYLDIDEDNIKRLDIITDYSGEIS